MLVFYLFICDPKEFRCEVDGLLYVLYSSVNFILFFHFWRKYFREVLTVYQMLLPLIIFIFLQLFVVIAVAHLLIRYHIARVYRRDNPKMESGRYREFYQCVCIFIMDISYKVICWCE